MLFWLLAVAGLVLIIVPGLFVNQVVLGIAVLALALLLLAVNVFAFRSVTKRFDRF